MKNKLILLGLLIALVMPAFAQRDTIRSNKNEFSIGYDKFMTENDDHGNSQCWNRELLIRTLPLNELPTMSFSLGETVFENVYYDEGSYSWNHNGGSWAWYYSEQAGLLSAKNNGISLTLIP